MASRVLLLDDEKIVTDNLTLLIQTESTLEPVAFNSPDEALKYLAKEPVDAILSDFIMPGMNGLEVLAQAREIRPTASRLLLTGYADKESAIRAINDVGLFQYLEKPWDNSNLLNVLQNATERSQLLQLLREKTASLEELRDRIWRSLA